MGAQDQSYLEIVATRLKIELNKAPGRDKLKVYAATVKVINDLLLSRPPLSFAKKTIIIFESDFSRIIVGLQELRDVGRGIAQAKEYMLKARISVGVALAKFDTVKSRANSLTECHKYLDKALNYLEPLAK